MKKTKYKTAIDLFSGCGGLTLGLKMSGCKVLSAIEFDEISISSYKKNHKDVELFEEDIRNINPNLMMENVGLGYGELDLLAGCPPCQSFSTLKTKNGLREYKDDQSDLVFNFVDFVKALLPKNIMLENVPALAKDARIQKVINQLNYLGYLTNLAVLNANDFGVPQRRKRMILLASRCKKPGFAIAHNKRSTVFDVIGKMATPSASKDPLHSYSVKHSERVLEIIRSVPKNGGSRKDIPERLQLPCHKNTDGFKDVYGRMAWHTESPTITGGCINPSKGRFLHPDQDRAITLREASLLQGFPADYKFDLSKGRYAVAQMIGNSFPPLFAKSQASELLRS